MIVNGDCEGWIVFTFYHERWMAAIIWDSAVPKWICDLEFGATWWFDWSAIVKSLIRDCRNDEDEDEKQDWIGKIHLAHIFWIQRNYLIKIAFKSIVIRMNKSKLWQSCYDDVDDNDFLVSYVKQLFVLFDFFNWSTHLEY